MSAVYSTGCVKNEIYSIILPGNFFLEADYIRRGGRHLRHSAGLGMGAGAWDGDLTAAMTISNYSIQASVKSKLQTFLLLCALV